MAPHTPIPLPLHHGDDWNLAIPRILTTIKGSGSLSTRSTGRLGMSAKTLLRSSKCSCTCSGCRTQSRLVCVFLQVYGASLKDPANACLVMELVKGGNLHQRIYDRSSPRLTHLEILQVSLPFG